MVSDFILRAALAGIGVALVAAPLGCFVVWRRMAYFGDTMAHSALLGAAAAIAFDIDATLGVFTISVLVALALLALERRGGLATDTLLGLLSHSALAVGLVVMGMMTGIRLDLFGYLFGDILAVDGRDLALIWGGGAVVLAGLFRFWRPLLADTVHPDLAAAEGMHPQRARAVLMLLMALVIAVAMVTLWLGTTGLGILFLGLPPTGAEVLRGLAYLVATIAYAGVWLALAMTLSTVIRSTATSALAALSIWLVLSVFWGMIAPVVASAISPVDPLNPMSLIDAFQTQQAVARLSPQTLYGEITAILLDPAARSVGPLFIDQLRGALLGAPLPTIESLAIVWPQMSGLIAAMILLFTAAYVLFQRQEIRA